MSYKQTYITCFIGYITQAISVNLLPLFFVIFQDDYQISFEKLGRLIFIFFVAQIVVDLIAVKYVDKIGYRPAAVAAHIFSTVGLIMLSILPRVMPSPYMGLVIAVLTYSVGSGMIEVLISPILNAVPSESKSGTMSLLHSFYCWGQLGTVLITTLILRIIGTNLWYIIPIFWALIPFWNTFRFIRTPLVPPIPEEHRMSVKDLFKTKIFIIVLVLMTCSGAAEIAMSQWSSLFCERSLGVPKVIGDLLGPGLFALFMGIGRAVYGIFGHKLNLARILMVGSILCIACYLLAALSSIPILALIGCALCGLSVSIMWPGVLSMSAEKFPNGGTALFGLCAVFGDLGAAAGPWMTGLVADSAGLNVGLLVGIAFPVVMIGGVLMFRYLNTTGKTAV